MRVEIDYQGDHAAVFAQALCLALRQKFPSVNTRYLLLTAEPTTKPGPLNRQLVHAYVAFAQFLLDSDGVSELQDAKDRLEFWEEMEEENNPSEKFSTELKLEMDLFPELIRHRCPDDVLKKHVERYLARPDIRRVFPKTPVRTPNVSGDKKID